MKAIGDLVRVAAAQRPDVIALVDGAQRLSWAELNSEMSRAASQLASGGLSPGDRLAVQLPTSVEFVRTYLGALEAGLVVVPVNPGYTLAELDYILSDSGARALISAAPATLARSSDLPRQHSALAWVVGAGEGFPSAGADALRRPPMGRARMGEDLAVLLYTSGTSGHPKGAMLPVRALMANLDQFAELGAAIVTSEDVIYLPVPMFHIFGLNAGLGMALRFGARLVLAGRFSPAASLAVMAAEGATVVLGAPLEFASWLSQPTFADGFRAVRLALSGSAPLPADLVQAYAQLGISLYEGYGLTEAAPVVTVNLSDASGTLAPPKLGSIGRALPGVEVRLLDPAGEVVEPGDLGTLEVRGANLFTGYWPEGSGGPDHDGWFSTGDLALEDDDGDYYLVGRRTDLILVNGFNVYPAEVEAVLRRVDGVREVAVLGEPDGDAPDPESSQAVVAYVVPEAGTAIDTGALLRQAGESLAKFKLPKRIVEVDALPHTATGKVMKWRLRAASGAADEASGPNSSPAPAEPGTA